jgi:AcrR family transcriptional regulator
VRLGADRRDVRPVSRLRAACIEPSLTFLEPRKRPRQARARATYTAIVDACAQLLAVSPYDSLTTNGVAERAGVSIGTLYEYFPNRESIVAALAADACRRLVARSRRAAEEAAGMGDFQGIEHLLVAGIGVMAAPENAFRALVQETPFVLRLPAFREARATLDALCQGIRVGAGSRINLPEPEADAWLISQMLFNTMLEIAVQPTGPAERARLTHELARLTFRMALGRDATAADMTLRRLS